MPTEIVSVRTADRSFSTYSRISLAEDFIPSSPPPLFAQHPHRVFAQDCRAQLQRRTLNGVEAVLKKRCVHVVVVRVPKQRIDCQKRLGNDHYNTRCKSVVGRLGNPEQGP